MRLFRLRPRLYEIVALANALAVLAILRSVGRLPGIPWDLLAGTRVFLAPFAVFVAGAVAWRAAAVAVRDGTGRSGRFLAATARPVSSLDLVRLLAFAALVYFGHVWLKIMVPFLNPRLLDPALARLDAVLHFGLNPGPLALGLFPWPAVWRVMDVYYAAFIPLTMAGFAWFLTVPSRPERARFAAGFTLLWVGGAWLYVACPSLGPCYVFPADFSEALRSFPLQGAMQNLLIGHYRALLSAAARHEAMRIVPLLGIGAMPSLHVAAHAFLALFAWKRSRPLGLFYAAATALTFYGSLITGWHYAVDGYAGLLLAVVCWRLGERMPGRGVRPPGRNIPVGR